MQSKETFSKRREQVFSYLEKENIDAAVIEDNENRRNPALRYLCGMPSDGILFLTKSGKSLLTVWDTALAGDLARADELIPYTDFGRDFETALRKISGHVLRESPAVELGSATPFPLLQRIRASFSGEILCRENGIDRFINELRQIKDPDETAIYRKASRMTDIIFRELLEQLGTEGMKTELDIAMFIETEARKLGAEGTGFPTIAAGPERSFAIHAHPSFTGEKFGTEGLSIADFGVLLEGYTTDVTFTFCAGNLTPKQQEMAALVEEAYDTAAALLKPGVSAFDLSSRVDLIFEKAGYKMPHALGHGIGLASHEAPVLRSREENGTVLLPGMIITIEPGLYDKTAGGVRYENDFLITENGAEQLTACRIVIPG